MLTGVQAVRLHAQNNPEVKAIQLFDSGQYEEAEALFRQLLEQNPHNPVSKYYYGAVRTENNHYSEKELACLTTAGENFTPDRLHYYLGVQHHARDNWDQALKYYNLFRMSVPVSEQQEVELDKKIQLCFNKVNPFTHASGTAKMKETETHTASTSSGSNSENSDSVYFAPPLEEGIYTAANSDDIQSMTDLFVPGEVPTNLPDVNSSLPSVNPVNFLINSVITYNFTSQFQTEDGRKFYEKGQALQNEQEMKLKEADYLRNTYKTSSSIEIKNAIASKILILENETYQLEEDKVTAFLKSRELENAFWEKSGPVVRNNFLIEQEKALEALKHEELPETDQADEFLIDLPEHQTHAPAKVTPKAVTYKIQIGAYSKGVPAYRQRLYNKLSKIRTIDNYTDENGVVVYTTGNLSVYEDALTMRNQVKQEGIEDAIVIAYFNGKRITLEQANEIEAKNDI